MRRGKRQRRSGKWRKQELLLQQRLKLWFAKRPIFTFVLLFVFFMSVYYAVTGLWPYYTQKIFPAYLNLNAQVSGGILTVLQRDVTVVGDSIFSSQFAISIKKGCDAIEPTALFAAIMLAFPAPFLKKIPGLLVGVIFLLSLNLVRIVSLYLVGVHAPKFFHTVHIDVWPAIFIFLALVSWIIWIQWAIGKR